jgi:hypothetical protein
MSKKTRKQEIMPDYNENNSRLTRIRQNLLLFERRSKQQFPLPSWERPVLSEVEGVRVRGRYQAWSPSPHSSPLRDCVAIPFMVREPHHERDCLIVNSSAYPFALSPSKGSERIATQSPTGEDRGEGALIFAPSL